MPTVLRVFLCLAFASAAWCEPLDEAVHALAKKLSARLAPGDGAQVALRNISKLSGGEAARARVILERSLRRSGSHPVDVLLTVSQSFQDVVLVAEFDRNGEHLVEMARFRPDAPPPARRVALEKRLLLEQPIPVLDIAEENGALLVLEPQAIVRYERSGTAWQRTGSKPLEGAPVLRDQRGRLQVSNGALVASLPGITCRGTTKPALEVRCEESAVSFELDSEPVEWTAGRNTLESPGWTAFFSLARVDGDSGPLYLAAELDGRTHIYDGRKAAAGTVEGWGSDLIAIAGCEGGRLLLVSGMGDSGSPDALSAWRIGGPRPVQAGDAVNFSGPVTALWPAENGAVAVSRNPATGDYAAYSVAVDCGR
jgi:hypothetical protein